VIQRFAGHVAQYGDAYRSYFGYPQAHEMTRSAPLRTGWAF